MKNLISDKDFCSELKLDAEASQLFKRKQYKQAALHAARSAFAKPFAHPVKEQEIAAMAALINKEVPDQVALMEQQAKKYWMKAATPEPTNTKPLNHVRFQVPNTVQRSRGIAVYSLARLARLTGNKKYTQAAMKMLRELAGQYGDYPQGDNIGFYSWHPHTAGRAQSHTVAHMSQEFNMMMPFIRDQISDEDKLYLMKFQWTIADVAMRGFRMDQSFNLTLHFATPCHETALLFPVFKQSKKWIKWARFQLQEFYDSHGVTADGYTREGVLYQRVNHHLLELNMEYIKAAGHKVPKKLEKVVHNAHMFNANICPPDGYPPHVGDTTVYSPHEHWIHAHETLHLTAAITNKAIYKQRAGTPYYRKAQERNFWEMGLKKLQRYLKMPWGKASDLIQKPADHGESGFQILGNGQGNDRNFGALLFTQNHNHAHHDIGSIYIYAKGRPLISDPAGYGGPGSRNANPDSHSLAMLPRFSPAGPRLHTDHWAKSKFAIHNNKWQATSMQHRLYDGYKMQRTLVLIPGKKNGPDSFWVVLDKVTPDHPHPLGLHELVDTSFHFSAIETDLGIDGLQTWSQHDLKKKTATVYKTENFSDPGKKLDIQEFHEAYEMSNSNGNIQVAGFALAGTEFSLEQQQSHSSEYSGYVKRPAALYRYRGPLPAVFAYVLVPFTGIKKRKPINIDGQLKKNSFSFNVNGREVIVKNGFSKKISVNG